MQIIDPKEQSLTDRKFPPVKPSELPEYEGIIEAMRDSQIERCLLFGSTARGERREDSDIDLFIVIRDGDLLWKLWSFEKALRDRYPHVEFDVTTTLAPFVFENAIKDFKEIHRGQ